MVNESAQQKRDCWFQLNYLLEKRCPVQQLSQAVQLDLSDVKPRVGQEVGGGELIEPCTATDIRRWVMAMDYPEPDSLGPRVCEALEVRRHRRAAVLCRRHRLWARRAAGLRGPRPWLASDLRRRGVVALRPADQARRPTDAEAALSRLQSDGHEVRGADAVPARRYGALQPARRSRCARSVRLRFAIWRPKRSDAAC